MLNLLKIHEFIPKNSCFILSENVFVMQDTSFRKRTAVV